MILHRYLDDSAARHAQRIAVIEPDVGQLSYRELALLSDRLRDRLRAHGIRPGDRVGLFMSKTIDAVASLFGIMKAGAAYVPVDAGAPPARAAYIFADCRVAAVIVEARHASAVRGELAALGVSPTLLPLIENGGGHGLARYLDAQDALARAPEQPSAAPDEAALGYILYTSGSTGTPKGVMLTHGAGSSFVEWSVNTFAPSEHDRFSSHAPLHFDLSVFDLYVAIRSGAALVLISEELGRQPAALAELIGRMKISIWYSAPSILGMLARTGELEHHDHSALRLVLFAGEVFPIERLRNLTRLWPEPRFVNLYGPTETNVCSYHAPRLPIAPDRTRPLPIGKVCENLVGKVIDAEDRPLAPGQEGELVIAGPNLMAGYWQLPEHNARAFLQAPDGLRYYRTGDLVIEQPDGNLEFKGQRDRIVEKRGHRVELGEIEACLYRHPDVVEAAVVAISDAHTDVAIRAHLTTRDGARISMLELKQFCSGCIPLHMVPDSFRFHDALPKTSTDKTDYQRLVELA